ncbi:MAG: cytochrome c oxidase subunit II [Desulfovibrionaceae bacterium]|jgi:cytochrome c oxidase subunit 2|nr:cytochrome c oxidase subunit II [Desulfovibrionaceae bacterium]
MYPQVFEAAKQVDQAFLVILGFCVFILLLVSALMGVFVWRYHHTRHPHPADIDGNVWAELAWTIIPTCIVMGLFWFGWTSYTALRNAPEGALQIGVEARMWSWSFIYPDGKRSAELVVPVDRPVKLHMTSKDVIHSFYVPAMRIKMDTVPGMQTYVWFESDSTGVFDILCAEYCGLKHANMISVLRVVSAEEYAQWLSGGAAKGGDDAKGGQLLEDNGCLSCHSLDGSEGVGPTFKGLAGREVAVLLPDGSKKREIADETYVTHSILAPSDEVVEGFDDVMPGYADSLSKEDVAAMVHYLLKGGVAAPPPGRAVAEEQGCLSCHSTDGSVIAGPSFKGVFGAERLVRANGEGEPRTVVADEAYLRESIRDPGKEVVDGFENMMPAYDVESLDDGALNDLVDYVESLAGGGQGGGKEGGQ